MNWRRVEKQRGTDSNYLWRRNRTWHEGVTKPWQSEWEKAVRTVIGGTSQCVPIPVLECQYYVVEKRMVRFRRLLLQGRRIRCSMCIRRCLHFWTPLIVEEKWMAETISAQGAWEDANTCSKSNCRVNQEKAEKEGGKVKKSSQNTVSSSIRFAWEALVK